jgi:hypothetical protein
VVVVSAGQSTNGQGDDTGAAPYALPLPTTRGSAPLAQPTTGSTAPMNRLPGYQPRARCGARPPIVWAGKSTKWPRRRCSQRRTGKRTEGEQALNDAGLAKGTFVPACVLAWPVLGHRRRPLELRTLGRIRIAAISPTPFQRMYQVVDRLADPGIHPVPPRPGVLPMAPPPTGGLYVRLSGDRNFFAISCSLRQPAAPPPSPAATKFDRRRAQGATLAELASSYGVGKSTISRLTA